MFLSLDVEHVELDAYFKDLKNTLWLSHAFVAALIVILSTGRSLQ